MNLIGALGFRTIYSIDEVAGFLQLTRKQVEGLIRRSKLRKGGKGRYCIFQQDINKYVVALNAGQTTIGARK